MTLWPLATIALLPLALAGPPSSPRSVFDQTFDYVVIGGGTAGLTMAARLSEDPSVSVAVVEPGTYYQVTNFLLGETPAGDTLFAGSDAADTNPLVDWNFVTAPQQGANGRKVHYARGKCLGGSSARNFMIYQRPDRGSLQQWADAVDDQSYTFDNWLPSFKKSMTFTSPKQPPRATNATTSYLASAFDTSSGPLQVSYPNYAQPFSSWIQLAMAELGILPTSDFNSGTLNGSQYCSTTISPGDQKRSSSQTSFYDASKSRANLKSFTLTQAKKIMFDGQKRATGVLLSTGVTLNVRKEVIVSAGAFQSPQMLMVSGVGPAAQLAQLGIPLVADRPGVGQNMTDHIFFSPSYRVKVDTFTKVANLLYIGWEYLTNYLPKKQGPLTNPVADFLAWEKTPRSLLSPDVAAALSSKFPSSWPEIEYLSAPGYIGDFKNLFTIQPKDGYQYASILAALVAPLSRGTVTLTSSDTSDLPVIDPQWLTHPVDAAVAVAAYKRVRAAFATRAMAPVLADMTEYFPGPKVATDDQVLATIRSTLMTVYHAACTCRMGLADDPTAVVDSSARVIGVQGVRVVDASAFALLPPGHPQSVVYALAEKIADRIQAGG